MTTAAGLLLNGLWIAVVGPSVLQWSTRRFTTGWAILAWSAAIVAVLVSWVAAAVVAAFSLVRPGGHLHWLLTECLSAVRPLLAVTSNEAAQAGLRGAAAVATLAVPVVLARLLIVLSRTRARTHRHCRLAYLVGARQPEVGDALVVETPERCIYCVAGRPAAIVVTRGALEALNGSQLAAVLAHERAHLAERHHLLVALSRGTTTVLPQLRLFRLAAGAIARLIEIRADDIALRDHAGSALAGALLALTGGAPLAATALGATSSDVSERIKRLLQAPAVEEMPTRTQVGLTTAIVLVPPALSLGLVAAAAALCRLPLG